MSDSLSDIPLTTQDIVDRITPDDPQMSVDLNRIQSGMIQEKLRSGQVTPEEVAAWKESNGLAKAEPVSVGEHKPEVKSLIVSDAGANVNERMS